MSAICDGCHKPIPSYPDKVNAGYVSPISDTWKWIPTSIGGVAGVENIPKIVCRECFEIDWAVRYPGIPHSWDNTSDELEQPMKDGNVMERYDI